MMDAFRIVVTVDVQAKTLDAACELVEDTLVDEDAFVWPIEVIEVRPQVDMTAECEDPKCPMPMAHAPHDARANVLREAAKSYLHTYPEVYDGLRELADRIEGLRTMKRFPYICAECGRRDAATYVVTTLDYEAPAITTTEVCRECDDLLRSEES